MRIKLVSGALLSIGLLSSCSGYGSNDSEIIVDATSNIFSCEDGTTMFFGYLGQYYVEGNGCNGSGSKVDYAYAGMPEPPMVFRWKAIKFVPGEAGVTAGKRFFYAESHEPMEFAQRAAAHQLYEIHVSLGPRLMFSESALADPAIAVTPREAGSSARTWAAGDVDTLYYFVRSRPRHGRLPLVTTMPYRFRAVKGIELTEAQYMTIACERSVAGECSERLEEGAPGLNEGQRAYLRAARSKAPANH